MISYFGDSFDKFQPSAVLSPIRCAASGMDHSGANRVTILIWQVTSNGGPCVYRKVNHAYHGLYH